MRTEEQRVGARETSGELTVVGDVGLPDVLELEERGAQLVDGEVRTLDRGARVPVLETELLQMPGEFPRGEWEFHRRMSNLNLGIQIFYLTKIPRY